MAEQIAPAGQEHPFVLLQRARDDDPPVRRRRGEPCAASRSAIVSPLYWIKQAVTTDSDWAVRWQMDAAAKRRGEADLKCTQAESALAIRFLPSLHAAARLRRSRNVGSPGANVGSVSPVPAQMWQGARSPGGDVVWRGEPSPDADVRRREAGLTRSKTGNQAAQPDDRSCGRLTHVLRHEPVGAILARRWVCAVRVCSAVQCQACALTRTAARVGTERARPSPYSVQSIRTIGTGPLATLCTVGPACNRPLRVGPPGLLGNRKAT